MGAGGILIILITGLVLSVAAVLGTGPSNEQHDSQHEGLSVTDGNRSEPAIGTFSNDHDAAAHPPSAATSSTTPAPLVLPASAVTGIHGVATGYPQSPEGAVAQLAAIDVAVLSQPFKVAERSLRAWSNSETVRSPQWTIEALIDDVRDRPIKNLRVIPVMARVDKSATQDRHNVCLLLRVQIPEQKQTADHSNSEFFAHCEAMIWTGRHWLIQHGQSAASEPIQRPGSGPAYAAGYRMLQGAAAPDQR
ncbi:hypothetical protein [Kineosporia babensis]|uniref:Uncharacterized protein n=1 Tax=Kineosporia babensis TaxID=499548 RepID=A0A9X1SYY9_9ACTN|nr:hypothetical protein [Kineosporia babensis]MCD5316840.1 hypothetical protein [Kineosporia babensis]